MFSSSIETISDKTKFQPTKLIIYDKSIDGQCNRLIVVEPFYWVFLATGGEVYVLNAGVENCPDGFTNAVVVPHRTADSFRSTCIRTNVAQWIHLYKNTCDGMYTENFNLTELQHDDNKFTIIDMVNYLFTRYITIDEYDEANKMRGGFPKTNLSHYTNTPLRNINRKMTSTLSASSPTRYQAYERRYTIIHRIQKILKKFN